MSATIENLLPPSLKIPTSSTSSSSSSSPDSPKASFLFPAHSIPSKRERSTRPAWIGPPARQRLTKSSAMKQDVKITFSKPGTQPPVYVTTSLSEPQWQPVEMHNTQKEEGEYEFWHEFEAEPGEYQYKFRLGPGDWWVLDEKSQTVEDGSGNRNNLLVVDAPKEQQAVSQQQLEKEGNFGAHIQDEATAPIIGVEDTTDNLDASADVPESEHSLMRHESIAPPERPKLDTSPADYDEETHAPLLRHESNIEQTASPARYDFAEQDHEELSPLFRHESGVGLLNPTDISKGRRTSQALDIDGDSDEEDEAPPLFRHESLALGAEEEDQAPLFRHESMLPDHAAEDLVDEQLPEEVFTKRSPSSSRHITEDGEDDVNDPSLERFPTDQAGIMQQLQRVSTILPDDTTEVMGTPPSPTISRGSSSGASQPPDPVSPQSHGRLAREPSNLSMRSNTPHSLDAIGESEEEDSNPRLPVEAISAAAAVQSGLYAVSEVPGHEDRWTVDGKRKEEAKEQQPQAHIPEIVTSQDRTPLTPPMTPKTEGKEFDAAAGAQNKVSSPSAASDGTDEHHHDRKDNTIDNTSARSQASTVATSSTTAGKHAFLQTFLNVVFGVGSWFARLCGGRGRATTAAVVVGIAAAALALSDLIAWLRFWSRILRLARDTEGRVDTVRRNVNAFLHGDIAAAASGWEAVSDEVDARVQDIRQTISSTLPYDLHAVSTFDVGPKDIQQIVLDTIPPKLEAVTQLLSGDSQAVQQELNLIVPRKLEQVSSNLEQQSKYAQRKIEALVPHGIDAASQELDVQVKHIHRKLEAAVPEELKGVQMGMQNLLEGKSVLDAMGKTARRSFGF